MASLLHQLGALPESCRFYAGFEEWLKPYKDASGRVPEHMADDVTCMHALAFVRLHLNDATWTSCDEENTVSRTFDVAVDRAKVREAIEQLRLGKLPRKKRKRGTSSSLTVFAAAALDVHAALEALRDEICAECDEIHEEHSHAGRPYPNAEEAASQQRLLGVARVADNAFVELSRYVERTLQSAALERGQFLDKRNSAWHRIRAIGSLFDAVWEDTLCQEAELEHYRRKRAKQRNPFKWCDDDDEEEEKNDDEKVTGAALAASYVPQPEAVARVQELQAEERASSPRETDGALLEPPRKKMRHPSPLRGE